MSASQQHTPVYSELQTMQTGLDIVLVCSFIALKYENLNIKIPISVKGQNSGLFIMYQNVTGSSVIVVNTCAVFVVSATVVRKDDSTYVILFILTE